MMQNFKTHEQMNVLNIVISNNRKFTNRDGGFTRGPLSREKISSQTDTGLGKTISFYEVILFFNDLLISRFQKTRRTQFSIDSHLPEELYS